jgi:tripartite ATP-independent transporter DctM subunit
MSAWFPAGMLALLGAGLFTGLPVAVVLIAVAFAFAAAGIAAGVVRPEQIGAIYHRIYGTLADRDDVLYAAVPMLLFMGAVLHESRLASDLLAAVSRAFGRVRGGAAVATLAVSAVQAPTAGMIGASTGALALYALPALRRQGYGDEEAAGLVAAAGSLGAVAPPGVMLFFVGDATGVQIPALFLAMLGPLVLLLGLYAAYAVLRPGAPRAVPPEGGRLSGALLAAGLMAAMVALVGFGLATLSEAAALGAAAAVLAAAACGRLSWRLLDGAIRHTALMSAMIFLIFVAASVFSLVFRLLGGAGMIAGAAAALGTRGPVVLAAALLFIFVLGFFLDWLEIVVIALPVLSAAALAAGAGQAFGNPQIAGCWIAALFALALQTSFLTPPFGYALFLVHGATGGALRLEQVWRGALPFVALQIVALAIIAFVPAIATWLPSQLLDLSLPAPPKFSE